MSIMQNRLSRRQAIKKAAWAAVALPGLGSLSVRGQSGRSPKLGPYHLPPLPYALDALEPYIDTETLHIHYAVHHRDYVRNLNKTLIDQDQEPVEKLLTQLDKLPKEVRSDARHFGGGHYNHSLYWRSMTPFGSEPPSGPLAQALVKRFASVDKFREELKQTAVDCVGSGWVWLVLNDGSELDLETTRNEENPIMFGRTPLLGVDVWEHAYYLQYRHRRDQYVEAFFKIVNWDEIAHRYNQSA